MTQAPVREYWLQADSTYTNIVPTGVDGMMGTTFSADQASLWTVAYRAYTPNWENTLEGDDGGIGENGGIQGPTIRAQVGDIVRVHFRNNDTHYCFPHSIHPHGVFYRPDGDGTSTPSDPNRPGTAVEVRETYTYDWVALPDSVGTWPYHDHPIPQAIGDGPPVMELGAELGLFGLIAITDYHVPTVDHEFVAFFHAFEQPDIPSLPHTFGCINGRAFLGNTPTFHARVGESVRWRVASLGNPFHVFHVHGHRWLFNGRNDDSVVFGPATTLTLDYLEDNPGQWLYHCHVLEHMGRWHGRALRCRGVKAISTGVVEE